MLQREKLYEGSVMVDVEVQRVHRTELYVEVLGAGRWCAMHSTPLFALVMTERGFC